MKTLLFLFVYALVIMCHAETFVGPSSPTNRLVIETNQIIVISTLIDADPEGTPYADVTLAGRTGTLLIERHELPVTIAGPGELSLTNGTLVSFRRLRNYAFRSVLLPPNSDPISTTIDSGKTLRIASAVGVTRAVRFTTGLNSVVGRVHTGDEFSGQMTITFLVPANPSGTILYSHFITEDFAVVPELGLLQGPTGSFEITIERSADMQTWQPVVVHPSSSDHKAFYRMRIAR